MSVELHERPINLFVQLIGDPLNSSPALQCIDHHLQKGITPMVSSINLLRVLSVPSIISKDTKNITSLSASRGCH